MDEDFNVECSDDELKEVKGSWEPPAEEINKYYSMLEKGEIPELSWKCHGYRAPSPEITDKPEEDFSYQPIEDKSDFDFLDEASSPALKIRKDGEEVLKGSAKKKVTSLDGVINNMRRHNLLPSQTKEN